MTDNPAGIIVAVSVSETKGVKKTNVDCAFVKVDHGLEGDAHAGKWHRQVSLLAKESIDKMIASGVDVSPGDFAENVTTKGIEVHTLPMGTILRLGEKTLVEVTQIGKECHKGCAIREQVGDCVMPREGIFVKVLEEGEIRPDDDIYLMKKPTILK